MSVSIIVPARNSAATIEQTVQSLLGQTFRDWEAIVIDNGSSDGTLDVVANTAAGDSRVIVTTWSEPGVSGARNHGLSMASGDWIVFLDADDVIGPDHLEALAAAARRHDGADVIYCDWVLTAPNGRMGERRRVDITLNPAAALANACAFPIHAALTRASAIAGVGGFDPALRICEDWDLWQRLAFSGAVFRRCSQTVAAYRLSSGTATTDLRGFLVAAVDVIRRGHAVLRKKSPHFSASTAQAETAVALWLSGRALGAGDDATDLLMAADVRFDLASDASTAADALLDGMIQGLCDPNPVWPEIWSSRRQNLLVLLKSLEPRFAMPDFARLVLRHIEDAIARRMTLAAPRQLGTTHVQSFDISDPPTDMFLPDGIDRVVGIATHGGRAIGRFGFAPISPVRAAEIGAILSEFGISETGANVAPAKPAEGEGAAPLPSSHWDDIFEIEDPWTYDNPYETLKYEQTLAAIPDGVGQALELACAEGHFTRRLARKVDRLIATDISSTAVERARIRCKDIENVSFSVLDLLNDPLPQDLDLIVCSEVLYYFEEADDLALIADRIAAALRPGGHLVMTHAYLKTDAETPRDIGFDWGHRFGARSIGAIFAQARGLVPKNEFRSDLYAITVYRRDMSPPAVSEPVTIPISDQLPEEVLTHVDWSGRAPARFYRDAPGVPVLMYHRIASDPAPGLARYATAPEAFESQMLWLKENGYSTIGVDALEAAIWEGAALPDRAVAITFDDGYRDNLTNALPVLARFGQTATIFVPTDHVGGTAAWDRPYGAAAALMTWDELATVSAAGLTLASHGRSHRPLSALTPSELADEAALSRDKLREHLGVATRCFAYPYGIHDEAVQRALLAQGYRLAFTTQDRRWQPGDRVMAVPRVEVPGGISRDAFAARLRAA